MMKRINNNGFSLIELLIVITVITILSLIVSGAFNSAREKAYFSKSKLQFKSFEKSLELYKSDNRDNFPPDANRSIPSGLEAYLSGDNWPDGPWPGSVYDWENWDDPDTPGAKIYQVSVRFCPAGGTIDECRFPTNDWAIGFGVNSSVYYCIEGACRPHINEALDYPGYCINC